MRRLATGSVIFFICLFAFAFVFVTETSPEKLIEKLEAYLAYYTPEKIYLHTDKPYYSTGDTIWFATYLVHGVSHIATAPSKIVYVELINSEKEVLSRLDIGIEDGTGAGEFALADSLASGEYLLRAYTSFMRNFDQDFFYHKQLRIENISLAGSTSGNSETALPGLPPDTASFNINDLVDVQFFPEGGDLVAGLWSTVGVKVTGPDGKGIEAQGEVLDSAGKKVADFSATTFGMGKFRFFPLQGEAYKALVRLGSQSIEKPFPGAIKEGYVLSASNLSKDYIAVKVEGNTPGGVTGGFLIGHLRGNVFLTREANESVFEALIPKKDLHEGVATLTWFDREGRPQCERLVFIEQQEKQPQVRIKGLKDAYKKREKVELEIEVLDSEGRPVEGVFSIAVTDKAKIYHAEDAENIRSYFLLSADIKGKIENPGYYFNQKHRDRLEALDNLLLTQGWRRFTWKDLIDERKPDINFLAEPEGFSIAGRVVDLYNDKRGVACKVSLTAANKSGDIIVEETRTDSLGYFLFTSLDLTGTTNLVLQTPNEKKIGKKGEKKGFVEGGEINLATKILLTEFKSPGVERQFEADENRAADEFFEQYLREQKKIKEIAAAFSLGKDVQILEEIEVRDFRFRQRERFDRPGMIHSYPTKRIDADSITKLLLPSSPFDIIQMGKVNGLQVSEAGVAARGGQADFYLDGLRVREDAIGLINSIPPSQTDFIDILQGPQAVLYRSRLVVLIYTKRESSLSSEYLPKGVESIVHRGYHPARSFYTPAHESKGDNIRPDIRSTLFWEMRAVDEAAESVEYYTCDVNSIFEIKIEGITGAGEPFRSIVPFKVN